MWEAQKAGALTHAAYEEIGGVRGALAGYAEQTYEEFQAEDQSRARRVFTQLVQPGAGTEDTRRQATRTEIGEDNWNLVANLADARLVVRDRDEATGVETVEIVHEALIREWGSLRH